MPGRSSRPVAFLAMTDSSGHSASSASAARPGRGGASVTWATRWPGKRSMPHVQIVGEDSGAPTTTLPFVIRSPGQWLVKKAAPAPSPVVDPWPNGIAKPLRCCIAGWADPYLQGLGKAWCRMRGKQAGEDRRVLCERSAQRTSWYTQCRPRGSPTIQPTCGAPPETTVGFRAL